jgi:hypothetical protein
VTTPPMSPTRVQLAGMALMVLSAAPLGWAVGEVVGRWRPRPAALGERAGEPLTGVVPAPSPA